MSILIWVFLGWAVIASAGFIYALKEWAVAVEKIDDVRTKLCKACVLIMSLDMRLTEEDSEPYSGRVTQEILKHIMDDDVEMEVRSTSGRVLTAAPAPIFSDDD